MLSLIEVCLRTTNVNVQLVPATGGKRQACRRAPHVLCCSFLAGGGQSPQSSFSSQSWSALNFQKNPNTRGVAYSRTTSDPVYQSAFLSCRFIWFSRVESKFKVLYLQECRSHTGKSSCFISHGVKQLTLRQCWYFNSLDQAISSPVVGTAQHTRNTYFQHCCWRPWRTRRDVPGLLSVHQKYLKEDEQQSWLCVTSVSTESPLSIMEKVIFSLAHAFLTIFCSIINFLRSGFFLLNSLVRRSCCSRRFLVANSSL